MSRARTILLVLVPSLAITSSGLAEMPADPVRDGAFGFPQAESKVLCEQPALRVSVWNDEKHLYVQAFLFKDSTAELGETEDGRKIGDGSTLAFDFGADGEITPEIDRSYSLNPWPSLPGLRYSVKFGGGMSSGLQGDSKGRGAIAYVETKDGARVRVDSYLVPLAEIGRAPGETVAFAFVGSSVNPDSTVNSVGFERDRRYYAHHIPLASYHRFTLAERPATLDATVVPRGRDDKVAASRPPLGKMPEVGSVPPDFVATEWINADGPLSLAKLEGRVVVVEFWATWCGPCVKNIPHLNELHDAHSEQGLTIIGFTDQSRRGIQKFLDKNEMKYVVAAGSELSRQYGVRGIPHAFVIGRNGTVRWQGHPSQDGFDAAVREALEE